MAIYKRRDRDREKERRGEERRGKMVPCICEGHVKEEVETNNGREGKTSTSTSSRNKYMQFMQQSVCLFLPGRERERRIDRAHTVWLEGK